ncbi:MAG: Major facilitator superfamily [Candidatus Moranbacteria bacterium GW2011_GWF2_34_56]|nr:MAG: Major facilitator superfamily [Candidatus Moranbacteria bacterium GW2011_GWF1_34_10]KKP65373.1 MAG: Major facilitator superfamily [Candidatus Moranbacteria bacterium GW2011_GWF2_34_56]
MSKKIIRIYVIFSSLFNFSHAFFFATYQLFLASRGMDLLEINIINMFFMMGIFLFEVPTGAFADTFGRKKSIVLGCFILAVSFLVYFCGDSLWIFILAELIGALGATFLSGALEAWVVDSLAYHDYTGDLAQVFRREKYFKGLSIIGASLMGGYMGEVDLSLPWLISAVSVFGTGIFAWFFLKEQIVKEKHSGISFAPIKKTITDSVSFGYRNKSVWFIILFGMLTAICFQALNMQWPFVFRENHGFSTKDLGWLFVFMSLAMMAGGKLLKTFSCWIRQEKDALVLSQLITAVNIIGASLMGGVIPVTGLFLLHEMGRGMLVPLKQAYLNKRIPSKQRATILSFDSMILKLGSFVGLGLSGYLAKSFGISVTWLFSGCLLAIIVLVFYNLKNGE